MNKGILSCPGIGLPVASLSTNKDGGGLIIIGLIEFALAGGLIGGLTALIDNQPSKF